MKEDHAARVRLRIGEHHQSFFEAIRTNDSARARKEWLRLMAITDQAIRDSVAARIEADSLATELQAYRPTRDQEPAAPVLDGYVYVKTANFPWVCASVEVVEMVAIPGLAAVMGYTQEHSTWEEKTVCGKKAFYPVIERFTSGGWPRLRELCPDCTRKLLAMPTQRQLFPVNK